MKYLAAREEAYTHPRHVLDGARSLLMLGMHYRTSLPQEAGAGQGRVSRYAWGTDYHDVIHERLRELVAWVQQRVPTARARGVVDSAPLLEREFAQLAGLGWIGKNTMLIHKPQGSWFFLAALLLDIELDYDAVPETDHCGTCRACLDACPTDAFVAPYVLDARKCISYLTIELRESVPRELRTGMGEWIFGCDVCQEVCPWNRKTPESNEPEFAPRVGANPMDLAWLLSLDDAAFRRAFRHTPLWRAKRRGLLRNAAIVLGNRPTPAGLSALLRAMQDEEPLVRGAAAWALGRYADVQAGEALSARALVETDGEVREEIGGAQQDRLAITSRACSQA
jgi:epoxyqueuosine reductase